MKLQDWLTETKAICDAATADNIFTTYESMRTALPLALQVIEKLIHLPICINAGHCKSVKKKYKCRTCIGFAEVEALLTKGEE